MDGTSDFTTRLIALLRAGGALQAAFIAGLAPEERGASGTFERWSARELVAHLVAWKTRRLLQLEAVTAGEALPPFDISETNRDSWDEVSQWTWERVAAEDARVTGAIEALVARLPDADLLTVDRYPLPYQPAARVAAGPTYAHIIQHLAERFIKEGDRERAIELRRDAARALDAIPELPEQAAAPHYNLACMLAGAGRTQEALEELRRALAWSPALAASAREDADFVPLRDDSAFQALVGGSDAS